MKRLLFLLVIPAVLWGCGGDAELKIINNTSRYVSGDVDGQSFGVVPGNYTRRVVEVGGFLSSSSKVEINLAYHATSDGGSNVIDRDSDKIKLTADHEHQYEVWMVSSCGKPILRLKRVTPASSVLGP